MIYRVPGPISSGPTVPSQRLSAWINFNGTSGGTIRSSHNITSATRTTTGTYTVTTVKGATATEYMALGNGNGNQASGSANGHLQSNIQNALNSFIVENRLGSTTLRDSDVMTIGVLGRF